MKDVIPKGKLKRTISSGKIVTRLGTSQIKYYLKKPFLSGKQKNLYKKQKERENAQILFDGLSLLRGTALKAAQLLSFENDLLPESIRKELEKSYHKVPPINRALVRKIMTSHFNDPPEKMFRSFDTKAFAAASLGQVHKAVTHQRETLALKVQYPDIAGTISSDIMMLKGILRPMSQYEIVRTALDEIETVLLKETDYEQEASNIDLFSAGLNIENVMIPEVFHQYTSSNILGMSFMEGQMLDQWLAGNPDRKSKNKVAQLLHDIFVKGFYEMGCLHADPNPGNFLVTQDLKVGLLDYGCVRKFDPGFIRIYQDLIHISSSSDKTAYLDILRRIRLINDQTDPQIIEQLGSLFMEVGNWFSKMFIPDEFDFAENPDFMEQGRKIGMKMHKFRNHIQSITPEFIFLDRTRYGLIRLFEKMGARIRIRNRYENCSG